jgi:hypothetical protein
MQPKIHQMTKEDFDVFIQSQLPIKQKEKKLYAEVFTDPELIEKMLDLFPKNIWSDPSLKWLDPSVGAGFFMIYVYLRLMKGLEKWEKNPSIRSTHILTNMLYMVELNPKNCKICKKLFGPNSNIFCKDFLKYDSKLSFDCIVGNPPFQDNYESQKTTKTRINGGKNKLYERILVKCIDLLTKTGYLSFVVPDNLFSGNSSISYNAVLQNTVSFVSFNPKNEKYFKKIQQPVCYFLLQKKPSTKDFLTTIEYDDEYRFQLSLKDRPVNPIRNWTLKTEKLINQFVSSKRNNVVYNRGKSIQSYKGTKFPIIYNATKTLRTNNVKLSSGYGIKKAIIFSISPNLEFKMDFKGNVGAGPNTFYVPFETKEEGKLLEKFLKSEEYKTLALATKTTRQYLKIAFLQYLDFDKIFKKKRLTKKLVKKRKNVTQKRHNI